MHSAGGCGGLLLFSGRPTMSETGRRNVDVEEFVRLLMAHERQIFTYILTLLPHVADAEDVLQETSIVLWRKFPEYQAGTTSSPGPSASPTTWCGISAQRGAAVG